jgi:hypothetical protein
MSVSIVESLEPDQFCVVSPRLVKRIICKLQNKAGDDTLFYRDIVAAEFCYYAIDFCSVGYSEALMIIHCCCNTDLCNNGDFTNSTRPSAAVTVFGVNSLPLLALLLVAGNYF